VKLSAVVIAKNEEVNIGRCLSSLSFCEEVIVVDANSTDRTVEIARKHNAKVFVKDWAGYVDQKNFAVGLASCDWIISVDADEEVSESLKLEIKQILAGTPKETAFSIPRKTIHSGQWIRYGGWYPNRLVRLFRKSMGTWEGGSVHEFWKTSGEVGKMSSDLIHYSFESLADQVARNNLYSTLGAEALLESNKTFSCWKLIAKPITKFLETYLLKRGFLDGYRGFFISVSAAYSVFLKWAKLWELTRDGKKD